MQLYALDKSSLILAPHALRDRLYICPECRGGVRKREGLRRQAHFYHTRRSSHPDGHCRQHGKSLAHLQIQLHLKSLIGALTLEKKIQNRVADALWEEEKIVFEVQHSPLSLEEAKNRCKDYFNLGYTPVWILHDRRFNRNRLSPAEEYLRAHTTTFFTDGRRFYDQFDVCIGSRRLFRGPALSVDLSLPRKKNLQTFRSWPLSFQGDLLHWAESHDMAPFKKIEQRYQKQRRWAWWKWGYKFLLYRLLESCN